jgi:hypothetical protein
MSSLSDADQLADRLDRVLPPHGLGVPEPAEGDPALAIALRLARGPHPALDAEAVARIGAHVLAAVDSRPVARRVTFRPALRVMRWAAAACLVLAIVIVSTATASARSLPGDTLYPVKRLVEQGRLALASDGSEVTLRLDLAGRRLDEFEALLNRGEVRPETLDDATEQMNSTLTLVEDGAGIPEAAANQLIDLSTRQAQLAEEASIQANGDPAKVIRLHEALTEANAVQAEARQLITPPAKPEAHSVPDRFSMRSGQQNLGRESMVFIPHDSTPAPAATTVDAPTTVFVQPEAPQSPASAPVIYRPPVVVPTSTPPAVDPDTPTPDEPPTVDPGNRPVADDPGDEPDTPTPDAPPPVDPGNPPDDRPMADDPGEEPTVDDPGDPPGDDPGTPVPDLPPTDDPGAAPPALEPDTPTPDAPPVAEPGDDLATPVPDLPPTDDPGATPDIPPTLEPDTPTPDAPPVAEPGDDLATPVSDLPPTDDPGAAPPALEPDTPTPDAPPVAEPGSPPGNDPAVTPLDRPPAADAGSPPGDVPAAVDAPVVVPPGDPPQADLAPTGEPVQVPPANSLLGGPASDGRNGN